MAGKLLNQALGSRVQVRVGLAQAVDQDSEKCGRQQKGYVLSPAANSGITTQMHAYQSQDAISSES